jgi:hypothetical protein
MVGKPNMLMLVLILMLLLVLMLMLILLLTCMVFVFFYFFGRYHVSIIKYIDSTVHPTTPVTVYIGGYAASNGYFVPLHRQN